MAINPETGYSQIEDFQRCLDPESLACFYDVNVGTDKTILHLREGDKLVACKGQEVNFDFTKEI